MTKYYLSFDVDGTTIKYGLIQTQIKVSHLANKAQLLGGIAELVDI